MPFVAAFAALVGLTALLAGVPIFAAQVRKVLGQTEFVPLSLIAAAAAVALGLTLVGGAVIWLSIS